MAQAVRAAVAGGAGGAAGTTPATPKGPPPRRSVLGVGVAGRMSTEGHGAVLAPSTGPGCEGYSSRKVAEGMDNDGPQGTCQKGTALEAGLVDLLEHVDK